MTHGFIEEEDEEEEVFEEGMEEEGEVAIPPTTGKEEETQEEEVQPFKTFQTEEELPNITESISTQGGYYP